MDVANIMSVRDVHKAPALDLVAVFTLGSPSGPLPEHVPVVQQLQHVYNDDLILVLFQPSIILDGELAGGKLPISLYESYYEPGSENADKGMQVEGWGQGRQLQMRFRDLSCEVETGEAEMIGIDFVAKGSGNASAIANAASTQKTGQGQKTTNKGKAKAVDGVTNGVHKSPLSPEEDERESRIQSHGPTGSANMCISGCVSHRENQCDQDVAHSRQPDQVLPAILATNISYRCYAACRYWRLNIT